MRFNILTYKVTTNKWVTGEPSRTDANRIVVYHFTVSTNATCSRAGIVTLLIETCLILGTL